MKEPVYRITEIVGSSNDGVDQAIRNALERAQQNLRNVDWFEVTEIRGGLFPGPNPTLQVTMKVGFRLEDHNPEGALPIDLEGK